VGVKRPGPIPLIATALLSATCALREAKVAPNAGAPAPRADAAAVHAPTPDAARKQDAGAAAEAEEEPPDPTDETQLAGERDLLFSFVPIAPPVRSGKTPILVSVTNRSKYPLGLSRLEDWVKGFGYFYLDKNHHPAGGGEGWGESFCTSPGQTICHLVTNLLVIPPGGTLSHGSEIDLSRADAGTVRLTLSIRLMAVPIDLSCAHTRMLLGEASQVIEIVKTKKR